VLRRSAEVCDVDELGRGSRERASADGEQRADLSACLWVLRGRSAVVRAVARQDAHDHDRAPRDVELNDHAPVTDA
jgi:hypothetical protein